MSTPPPEKALPSVGVVSLGCPKNLVDTEVMLGHLQQAGHAIVPEAEARVVLVNTCGFIDRAKEESVDTILEQVERKRRGEIDRVVVAGCMVQKYGRELAAEIPEVDAFVGLDELENAPSAAAGLPTLPRFTEKPLATRLYDERAPRVLSRRRGYAYLKVGEGCDNPCTFCTIPQMRGLQRSRSIASTATVTIGKREEVVIPARPGETGGLHRTTEGPARGPKSWSENATCRAGAVAAQSRPHPPRPLAPPLGTQGSADLVELAGRAELHVLVRDELRVLLHEDLARVAEVELLRLVAEELAVHAGPDQAAVGVDVDLGDAELGGRANSFSSTPLAPLSAPPAALMRCDLVLGHGRRAVHDQREAREQLLDLLEHVEVQPLRAR